MLGATPLMAVVLGYITTGFFLWFSVWFRDIRINEKIKPILFGIRGTFYAFIVYLTFIQLDSFVKYVFFGMLSYANLKYQLGALLLTIIWVIGVHMMVIMRKSTIKTVIFYISAWIYYIVTFLMNSDILGTDRTDLPVSASKNFAITLVIIEVLFDIIYLIKYQKRSGPLLDFKPLWDISSKIDKIFNRNFIIAFFILFSAELILQFEGLGLLSFL